jgi:hypothetical protein
MKRKKETHSNLKLAGVFIIFVLGLILLSLVVKFVLIVNSSRFDGAHNFIVNFRGEGKSKIVAFSPQNKSFSILNLTTSDENIAKVFEIPVDGQIIYKNLDKDKIPSIILHSMLSLGKPLKDLTILDALRLFIFSETVPESNIKDKELTANLNDAQKSTLIALSFTDPSIYQENQTIQIINATDVIGIGGRLATLISNIGGNVVLISTSDKVISNSEIVYYGKKSYTIEKLSKYLNIISRETNNRGVADVIITIGKDNAESFKF